MPQNTVITGIGSYIPENIIRNEDFINHEFLQPNGQKFPYDNATIIRKFKEITGIRERRYASPEVMTSDMAYMAAEKAIADAGIDRETIDYIIMAHNFGDVKPDAQQSDILPALATRVKHRLGIENPYCVAYDIIFGCPGWVEGLIQAYSFIRAGMAKRVLVIGAEALSRVVDVHDRDSMIYADGAGAAIVERKEEDRKRGILGTATRTDTKKEAYYLYFGRSFNEALDPDVRYIKMHGHKIYEYALNNVPQAMKKALDKTAVDIHSLKKIFIHQANEKMDEAIVKRFYRLYKTEAPEYVMPMSIHLLGNSSVATIPTLLDLVYRKKIENQEIVSGDNIMFASVGSGMNINAVVYRI